MPNKKRAKIDSVPDFHVGKFVKKLVENRRIKKLEFAKQLGYSATNISSLLNRKDWKLGDIYKASEILEENILIHFIDIPNVNKANSEESLAYQVNKKEKELIELRKLSNEKDDLIDLLRDYNKRLKKDLEVYQKEDKSSR